MLQAAVHNKKMAGKAFRVISLDLEAQDSASPEQYLETRLRQLGQPNEMRAAWIKALTEAFDLQFENAFNNFTLGLALHLAQTLKILLALLAQASRPGGRLPVLDGKLGLKRLLKVLSK